MSEPSRENMETNNLFARTDKEACGRFREYKAKDPFPEIPSALLNSADIYDYIRVTGMIFPFDEQPGKLKSASYEIDLLGEVHLWNDERKKEVIPLKRGETFLLKKNSIAFVFLATIFRIPDYIALRFNLKITHVHRGLLLGTGPLVDPGFEGRLLIPLHNLTSEDYELEAGEGLIWVEFTKVSPMPEGVQNAETHIRYGKYEPFPKDKKNKPPEYYFQKASLGNPIRSSIPDALLDTQRLAKEAERSSRKANNTVRWFTGTFSVIGIISFAALSWILYSSFQQTMSIVQDTTSYIKTESRQIEDSQSNLDQRNLHFQNDLLDKFRSLEKELQVLKDRVENIAKSPGSLP